MPCPVCNVHSIPHVWRHGAPCIWGCGRRLELREWVQKRGALHLHPQMVGQRRGSMVAKHQVKNSVASAASVSCLLMLASCPSPLLPVSPASLLPQGLCSCWVPPTCTPPYSLPPPPLAPPNLDSGSFFCPPEHPPCGLSSAVGYLSV